MAAEAKSNAKETFKRVLIEHKGECTHPEVKDALDNLVQLAAKERGDNDDAIWSPAHDMDINQGQWRSITTPPFPGLLDDGADGKRRFTLGRMSFGMFKPTTTVCAVEDIINIVEQQSTGEREQPGKDEDADAPTWTQTYNTDVLMEIETPSAKLPARLVTHGTCFPKSPTQLGVKFTDGTLEPRFDISSSENASLAASWKEIFDHAIANEAKEQSLLGQVGTWAMHKVMQMMMGLEPPVDTSDYTQTFTIGRPYVGY
ncbi:hypothetical protein ACHAXR_000771, partial [Thalassiosira sp. AJA248-18]